MAEETTHCPSADDLLAEILGEEEALAPPPPPPPAPEAAPARENSPGDDETEGPGLDDGPVEYSLRPSDDKVAVLLDCPDPVATLEKWVQRIHADLVELELPEFPDTETIRSLLNHACRPGENLRRHTLILAQAPVPSQDAQLAWSRDFFAEGWIINERTGQIDWRERVENCAVHRNEFLLRVHHAVEGVPGQDIYGQKIPVDKPERVRIRCGKGVTEVDEGDSTAFYAELDGRLRFADNTLGVDQVYHVTGSVGLATGNIHHTGSVTIDGDVLAESVIEADGDVVVKGLVEESIIICGGTLTVAGGILGGPGHKIRVGGNVEAKYIRETDLAAGGDVLVARQISHSRVRCLGSVLVPNGRIAGGKTIALRGIHVGTAGAPASSDTVLMAGVDYSLQAKVDLYHEKIARLEATLQPIENALRNAGGRPDEEFSESIHQIVENLAFKRLNLKEAISLQQMRVNRLMEASREEAGLYVVILKEVWSGTTIWLGEYSTRVKNTIQKPRIVQLREDRVRLLPMGDEDLPSTR
jgi:uncharacterized protein (DUF342 family)